MQLPPIVSPEEWQQSHEALLRKEKEAVSYTHLTLPTILLV